MKLKSLLFPILALTLGGFSASAESLPFWIGRADLEVEDVYEASNDPIILNVVYQAAVDETSLDDQDLWVVSQNGFNQLATFIKAEPMVLGEIDPLGDGEPFAEFEDEGGRPPEVFEDIAFEWRFTTYHLKPSNGGDWSEKDNGRYAVLLEPDQVRVHTGGALPATLLGDFHIRIGEEPPIEAKVDIHVSPDADGHQVASSVLQFVNPYYVLTDDGVISRSGNQFTINVGAQTAVFVEPDEAIFKLRHDLGQPDPGVYGLEFQVNGQPIHGIRFEVRRDGGFEIPAGADIKIIQNDESVIARVGVEIEPNDDGSIYQIGDWGIPRREGNHFILNARANGPLESFNTEPIYQEHDYHLVGDEHDGGDDHGDFLLVNYAETLPGILPEDPNRVRPCQMVAIPRTKLPVRFQGDVIAFPSPLPVDPFPFPAEPVGPPEGFPGLEIAAQSLPPGIYTVEFQIDGIGYAKAQFNIEKERTIPAKVDIDVSVGNASAAADVEVAFTGAPYHTVSDWGNVIRKGNHFILDAKASEIVFIQAPELPYFERHTYRLGLFDDPEPIDFKSVDVNVRPPQALNVVVQSTEEWWKLIGFEPGPNVLPAPNPVNFDEYTLAVVMAGAKPNGCYGVRIEEILVENGVLNVYYRERVPGPNEICTQAIVYPVAAAAFPKTKTPIDFINRPNQVGFEKPIPVEPDNGIGDGAGPLPDLDGGPIPVEPDNGIGDGAGPLPFFDDDVDIAARGPIYTVEFRMNGETYAQTSFRGSDVFFPPFEPDPDPDPHFGPEIDDPFIHWLGGFLPEEFPDGAAQGGEGDPDDGAANRMAANHDGDRWTDFEEFLLGLDPTNAKEPSGIWTEWVKDGEGSEHFAICFKRRKDADAMADFMIEVSKDLKVWIHDPELVDAPEIRELDGDLEEVIIRLTPRAKDLGFPFARLNLKEK